MEEVADHHDLDTTERAVASPDCPQPCIDGIDQIGADHRNLIDDEALHTPIENPKPTLIRQGFGVQEERWELEEGVDGLRLRIQGSNGRRGDDRLPFAAWTIPEVTDEPGFACAGSTNDQHDRRASVDRGEGLAHPRRPLIVFVSLKLGFPRRVCGLALRRQAMIELGELPRVGHGHLAPRLARYFWLLGGCSSIPLNRSRPPWRRSAFARLDQLLLWLVGQCWTEQPLKNLGQLEHQAALQWCFKLSVRRRSLIIPTVWSRPITAVPTRVPPRSQLPAGAERSSRQWPAG